MPSENAANYLLPCICGWSGIYRTPVKDCPVHSVQDANEIPPGAISNGVPPTDTAEQYASYLRLCEDSGDEPCSIHDFARLYRQYVDDQVMLRWFHEKYAP